MGATEVAAAVEALALGAPVILPTDGVYGLCVAAELPDAAATLTALKGRPPGRPFALLAPSVTALMDALPELDGRAEALARALFPGAYTLIAANPARRFGWLTGARPDTIGLRVANLPSATAAVLGGAGLLAATSANLSGGADPATLDEVPAAIRSACAAAIDAGRLPGVPSTVLDLTGGEVFVVRAGAGAVGEALALVEGVGES